MAEDNAQSGIPVVIDEWTVQLWADAKVTPGVARQLATLVDAALATAVVALNPKLAAARPDDAAVPRVVLATHGG
ncbi:MAG TPA: hypothetical protein VHE57_13220 [Mycobacteriales bacterium]|nr:hypothetical protein [Mycobacteriales bacterium]